MDWHTTVIEISEDELPCGFKLSNENGWICTLTVLEMDEEVGEVLCSVILPDGAELVVEEDGVPVCTGLPKFWLLFSLTLPHATRNSIFLPAYNEFLEDYAISQNIFKGRWDRIWIAVAFSLRTASMMWSCARISTRAALTHFGLLLLKMTWRSQG